MNALTVCSAIPTCSAFLQRNSQDLAAAAFSMPPICTALTCVRCASLSTFQKRILKYFTLNRAPPLRMHLFGGSIYFSIISIVSMSSVTVMMMSVIVFIDSNSTFIKFRAPFCPLKLVRTWSRLSHSFDNHYPEEGYDPNKEIVK